jgi:hypothetical protein
MVNTAASRVGVVTSDSDDFVPGAEPATRRDRIGRDVAEHRLQRGDAGDEQHPVGEHREQEIRKGAGQQHEDALPDRLAVVGLRDL